MTPFRLKLPLPTLSRLAVPLTTPFKVLFLSIVSTMTSPVAMTFWAAVTSALVAKVVPVCSLTLLPSAPKLLALLMMTFPA